MEILLIIFTLLGLSLFEVITSFDNAIINAEVLSSMSRKARRWFFTIVSILLTVIVWLALRESPTLAFGAVVGSSSFFIIHGFREYAQEQEEKLLRSNVSDVSKIVYLEVLDASFSIDGVIGAFAFTLSVLLILLGNGLGAVVLRQLTVSNIERIKRYRYLKNGAMYSILTLAIIMILDSFGFHIPPWVSPITTFVTVGYFFQKSRLDLRNLQLALETTQRS